ncbi:MAG: MCP four helix bundle domain-containing protein, partial [Polaromonas sp.]|uniref:methyl-accepting chemotaxis protein n=1 Tax=Polaromonas sp. TaxID=1869339 RepID=UPI0027303346
MFKNMKIGMRLSLGFGLVLLMLVAVILIGITRMSEINDRLDGIVNDNNVKMDLSQEMRGAIRNIGTAVRNVVLLEDAADMQTEVKRIAEQRKKYDDAEATLTKLITKEKGKVILAKIKEGEAVTSPVIDKVVKLGLANDTKNATDVMLKEVREPQRKWLDSLDEMKDFQEAVNKQDAEAAAQTYSAALSLMLIVGGIAVLLGAGIAFWLTRGVLKQLGGEPDYAAAIAGKIAAGDLAVAIDTKPNDQTSLLVAMKAMRDNLAKIVGEVRTGTDTIATATGQIAAGNQDLSSRTEEQASSLEETAASMEELTSTVKQNADNARQANQLAVSASSVAVRGGSVVAQVVGTMGAINASSRKI